MLRKGIISFSVLIVLLSIVFMPRSGGPALPVVSIGFAGTAQAAAADLVCDGQDDYIQWQQAVDQLSNGGQIVDLCGVTYDFTGGYVTVSNDNIEIVGTGNATYFDTDGADAIAWHDGGHSNVIFRDFGTDGQVIRDNDNNCYAQNLFVGASFVFEPSGGGSLDDAYDLGSSVEVDDTDVVWDLDGADFYINEAGSTRHKWDDGGIYYQTSDGAVMVAGASSTLAGYPSFAVWNCSASHDAGSQTYGGYALSAFRVFQQEYTDFTSGTPYIDSYASQFTSTIDSNFSGSSGTAFLPIRAAGIYGGSEIKGSVTSSGSLDRSSLGLYFSAKVSGTVATTGSVEDDCDGINVTAYNQLTSVSGTYDATTRGIWASASGKTLGDQIAIGVYGTASGADDNYACIFTRGTADTVSVAVIEQSNSVGLGAVLELIQADEDQPYVLFNGYSETPPSGPHTGSLNYYWNKRVIVEIDGVDYWLYLKVKS